MPVIPDDAVVVPMQPVLAEGTMPQQPCNWELIPGVCDDTWDTYPDAVKDFAVATATTVLWAATGRRYGTCERVVRPCGRYTNGAWNGALWGFWGGGLGWGWWPLGGFFFGGCGCGLGGGSWCECVPANQIWLPGPVAAVLQVQQDASIVPASAYRVDDYQWLVRTDGTSWPFAQDYNHAPGATNTLEVTYLQGRAVPNSLLYAGGILAAQYARACVNSSCQLPDRVTSVVRQNVSLQAIDPTIMLNAGLTGITLVDQVIMALNPYRRKKPPTVWSPDVPVTRTTTQVPGP